jgi:glutamate N-acetyltransferase/amino-acid N-acetyltransferase
MIEPRMATMLSFLLTDAAVEKDALQECLAGAADKSFNRITVDGDRSTNDTVLFLANGAYGGLPLSAAHPDWPQFVGAVEMLTHDLALKIVRDGEGATKVVTIRVRGARTDAEADAAARAVGNSLLVKTSWAGTEPNWGRVMDALGYSTARVEQDRVDISYDGLPAARNGCAADTPIDDLRGVLTRRDFCLDIDLHMGNGTANVYACDCTEEYIRINM